MRFYLETHKFTPTLGMFGDLGWFPLGPYRERLWNRLVAMAESRLMKSFAGTSTRVGKTGLQRWKGYLMN